MSRLPSSSLLSQILGFPFSPNPFQMAAKRQFRFCVPDEWYRRSKPKGLSPAAPSESTIRRLAALQEEDGDEDNDEGTAKIGNPNLSLSQQNVAKTMEQRGLVTQGRLSSIFDGWLKPTSPTSSSRTSAVMSSQNRKSVSEPTLVNQTITFAGSSLSGSDANDGENEDEFESAFEEMLVSSRSAKNKALLISYR